MRQQDWIKARRDLLNSVKAQVVSHLGRPSASLRSYLERLDGEFERLWQSTTFADLMAQAQRTELLLLGDFHAYYQSQRSHLRLLREIDLSQASVYMECFRLEDTGAIDAFWRKRITEAEFLKRIQWSEVWGFPWEHYRDLVLYLREKGVKVRGISKNGFFDLRLKSRDKKMAELLIEDQLSSPSRKIVVIVGEKHLYKDHLPEELRRFPRLRARIMMRVFQDNEKLYFRSLKSNQNWESSVLKRGDSFCWNSSPPWLKWQSYLMHLEQSADHELDEDSDYEDQVKAYILWMCSDLDLRVSCNHLEVYTSKSKNQLQAKVPGLILKELIRTERSFLLDAKGKAYLSRSSVNHASGVAGKYIHSQLSERKKLFYSLPKDFDQRIWIEAVGFFFSKWMNPSRKTGSFMDFRIRLDSLHKKGVSQETMKIISEIFVSEQRVRRGLSSGKRSLILKKGQPLSQLEAARFLGRIFGKALFEALMSERVSQSELRDWLSLSLESEKFSKTFWQGIVPRLI